MHLKATSVSGGVQLSWIRRTRIGGDSWAGEDVPLGEVYEKYEVSVYDGEILKRTLTASDQNILYTDADILADFGAGGLGPAFTFTVAQVSDVYGKGRIGRNSA